MALGRRFRYTALTPESRERWHALLRGELMDRLYVEPRYPGPSGLLWLLAGGSFVALAVMLLRRLGHLWTPPASGPWMYVVMALAIIFVLALLLIYRAHKLSTMFAIPPGRYLFPVGYLDATTDLWSFVSIREFSTAQLEDTRHPITRLPASICRLLLDDKTDVEFTIPSMDEAEEITDVVLLLIRSEDEVIKGLDALCEEFLAIAEEAAASTQQSEPIASDEPSRQLGWWLRTPLPLAIALGLAVGGGATSLRDALHVNQQIRKVRKRGDIELARMLLCWAPHKAQRQALSRIIRDAYMVQIDAFEGKASKARKPLGKKLLLPYIRGIAPVMPIALKQLPARGFSAQQKSEIDAFLKGTPGVRVGWSLASHLRQGLLRVFDRSLVWPRYGRQESGFFYYFMVGTEKASRLHYRKQQQIREALRGRSCASRRSDERLTRIEVSYQPFATGRHYELHTIERRKGAKGKHTIEKKRFPAISFGVVLRFMQSGETIQTFRFQLPPAVMLGFAQGKARKQGDDGQQARKVLLSGLRQDGSDRVYALMALAAWRKLKAQLPKALYGQPLQPYSLPKARVAAPASRPTPAAPASRPTKRSPSNRPLGASSRPTKTTSQPSHKAATRSTPSKAKKTSTRQR